MDIPAARAQHKISDAEVTVICAVNGKRTSVFWRNTIVKRVSGIMFHLVPFCICIIVMIVLVDACLILTLFVPMCSMFKQSIYISV